MKYKYVFAKYDNIPFREAETVETETKLTIECDLEPAQETIDGLQNLYGLRDCAFRRCEINIDK